MSYSPQDLHKKLLGKKGERLAVAHLQDQGYTILERNYKTPFGEADIIAIDGDEIVFVEVKARTGASYGSPKESVGATKQRRYYKIAQFYGLKTGEEPNARFDVAEVYADGSIEYHTSAF